MNPIIFDSRSFYDRGWWASNGSDELDDCAHRELAAVTAVNLVLPLLSGAGLPWKPDCALFCWDGKVGKTIKPRPPKPPGFNDDLAHFVGVLPKLVGGCHFTAPDRTESDDAVATAAATLRKQGHEVVVASGDKDLQQLARPGVHYYCFQKRGLLTPEDVCKKWGLQSPRRLAVYLAIVGDVKDGIHGVYNWGKVKATKLLNELDHGQPISELVESIAGAIPPEEVDNFYGSLDATLLNSSVTGVPLPGPIKFASPDELKTLGVGRLRQGWLRYTAATASSSADADLEP